MAVIWICIGMILMGIIVWFAMPVLMLVKHKSNLKYDETVTTICENLQQKKDWKVLNVNDYQKTTADFVSLEKVGSITICNPKYASKILTNDSDRGVTAFMPLELGVYENKKGQVIVSQLNFGLLGLMFGGTIAKVMSEASKDLNEVVSSVSS